MCLVFPQKIMLLFILIKIFLIHERLFLIQKLLLSDHTNQTAFVCQNSKKMFSLVLSHIYMLITFLPVCNALFRAFLVFYLLLCKEK